MALKKVTSSVLNRFVFYNLLKMTFVCIEDKSVGSGDNLVYFFSNKFVIFDRFSFLQSSNYLVNNQVIL